MVLDIEEATLMACFIDIVGYNPSLSGSAIQASQINRWNGRESRSLFGYLAISSFRARVEVNMLCALYIADCQSSFVIIVAGN